MAVLDQVEDATNAMLAVVRRNELASELAAELLLGRSQPSTYGGQLTTFDEMLAVTRLYRELLTQGISEAAIRDDWELRSSQDETWYLAEELETFVLSWVPETE